MARRGFGTRSRRFQRRTGIANYWLQNQKSSCRHYRIQTPLHPIGSKCRIGRKNKKHYLQHLQETAIIRFRIIKKRSFESSRDRFFLLVMWSKTDNIIHFRLLKPRLACYFQATKKNNTLPNKSPVIIIYPY